MSKFIPMMTAEQKAKHEKERKISGLESISDYYYPETVTFNARQLPEIESWEVGKEYEITIKVRMKSYEMEKRESSGEKSKGRFEIVAVKSEGKPDKKMEMAKKL